MKSCQAIECFCTDFNRKFCKEFREPAKAKKQLKKSGFKLKRRSTGELDFFRQEWEKRSRTCFITGEVIEFSPLVCFHILGKGAFPKYRLNPENLIFVKAQYHLDWHTLGQEKCLEKDGRWQKVIDEYNRLKIEYNGLSKP